jgi:catechol 2,3-dioxygenase-like lactoylglutathione lyase family enzyme
MTAVSYVPPNVLPPLLQKFASLLKRKWFRELVLAPPTITRRRFSNKTEDYGVFKPSRIAQIGQLSIYVQDIERSRQWYETLGGLRHSRTGEQELHPFKPGWTIRCCYMSAVEHEECLVLVEERDPEGKVTVPSGMSFFHTAFELEGNRFEDVFAFAAQSKQGGFVPNYGPVRHNSDPPLGDGETGGNVACYFYDPDYNNVEFCGAMDTIENYRARYGEAKGSARA